MKSDLDRLMVERELDALFVSGGARGIDSHSHLGALEGAATTTFVLPLGILAWRAPTELRQLMTRENTLALSAWPPDKAWSTRYALARNNIIAALGDGLFAVETGLKGGTTYSVREATRTRKPLWTLIYPPEDTPEAAEGNHSLLSSQANPLSPVEENDQPEIKPLVAQLRKEHSQRTAEIPWPPSENPEQGELFA